MKQVNECACKSCCCQIITNTTILITFSYSAHSSFLYIIRFPDLYSNKLLYTHPLFFTQIFLFFCFSYLSISAHQKKMKKMVALKSESDRHEMDSSQHPASLKVKCVTSNGLMPSKQWQFVSLCTHFDVEYWDGLFGFAVVACYTIHCLRNIL